MASLTRMVVSSCFLCLCLCLCLCLRANSSSSRNSHTSSSGMGRGKGGKGKRSSSDSVRTAAAHANPSIQLRLPGVKKKAATKPKPLSTCTYTGCGTCCSWTGQGTHNTQLNCLTDLPQFWVHWGVDVSQERQSTIAPYPQHHHQHDFPADESADSVRCVAHSLNHNWMVPIGAAQDHDLQLCAVPGSWELGRLQNEPARVAAAQKRRPVHWVRGCGCSVCVCFRHSLGAHMHGSVLSGRPHTLWRSASSKCFQRGRQRPCLHPTLQEDSSKVWSLGHMTTPGKQACKGW